ncbi:ATP-dependent helicase C-terminal domain-containing protein [Brevibacterium sp. NPDC049920]|uniref:ATP-dependent RNA helicase n=1 Tax=Brevibacterium sp. NPDC049920 TaxID=3155279 RepID=UPI0033E72404
MPLFDLDALSAGLPAAAVLPRLAELAAAGPVRAVIEAPPGTGKTTLVPPALATALADAAEAEAGAGRVVVAQPRRMAARSAARRLASLTGTRLGEEVGYTVRGDRSVSRRTRVEFVTSGVLVRRLLADPELAGAAAVVLDEIHERHLDTDLAFGMLRELVELREDLSLVVMSATLEAGRWAELLGEDDGTPGAPAASAPVLTAAAGIHPLEVRWAPAARRPLDARGVHPDFLAHVARQTAAAAAEPDSGDVLVFLPGLREIDRVIGLLRSALPAGSEVLALSGGTPPAEQDRILSPAAADRSNERAPGGAGSGETGRGPRVIVATAVAESSLTVPGVRTVVDAGLSRQPRLDTVRGMSGLVTVRESKAAGTQRAGRAAREGPGRVIRCMAESEWAGLPADTPPEVRTADLTSAMLDLACWGAPGGDGLRLPDPLPDRARAAAEETLIGLGALDDSRRATAAGRRLARIPADPRLARGLLTGSQIAGARRAAEVVAALGLELRAPGGDLPALLRSLRRDRDRAWSTEVDRFERMARCGPPGGAEDATGADPAAGAGGGFAVDIPPGLVENLSPDTAVGLVAALARPDRIARERSDAPGEYLFASGTGAVLPRDSRLTGSAWLAVAEVGLAGERALIRAAVPITREIAEFAASGMRRTAEDARFHEGRIRARRVERLGAIELSSTPVKPTPASEELALAAAVAEQGPGMLAPSAGFAALRRRLGLLHAALGEPWPDVKWEALLDRFSGRLRERAPVGWLQEILPWPEAARIDELVPERVTVPSGRAVRLDYPEPEAHDGEGSTGDGTGIVPPVLAVKLQECFGWATGPEVCGVPVVLHLLSPAGRPLAVTSDLASFWDGAYAHVRAENRNRYAKHPWPQDPWNAPPARGTKRSER